MQISNTYITVAGLQVYAYHGVLPIEQKVGNNFEVDAVVNYDAVEAMRSDDINTALNYANVVDVIVRTMAQPQQLLERVAMNIIENLNEKFPEITGGTITVRKLKPPIAQQMASVSFTLTWSR